MGIKHRNRCNASLKVIEQNKAEIADLKQKLEEAPAVSEPTPAAASELVDKTRVSCYNQRDKSLELHCCLFSGWVGVC